MRKRTIHLFIFLFLLASCAPQAQTSEVSETSEVLPTLPPTRTPIPTPTVHPQFTAVQETLAQSETYSLNSDGEIEVQTEEGMTIVPDIQIHPDGTMTFTHDEQEFTANTDTLVIDGQKITFQDTKGKTWVFDGTSLHEEIREFVPAETIEFTETLSKYDLELAKDADLKAIYWDIAVSHLGDVISKSQGMEANRKVYEEIIKDHPEWEGISHSADYQTRLAFMKEFLTRTGGMMTVTDMNWNKYEADFNKPIKFEAIEVNKLSTEYTSMRNLAQGQGGGGGGLMKVDEKGIITYSLALVPGCIEYYINIDPFRAYNNWGADWFISEFFAQTIVSTAYHSKQWFSDPLPNNYRLYIRGSNKNEDIVQKGNCSAKKE